MNRARFGVFGLTVKLGSLSSKGGSVMSAFLVTYDLRQPGRDYKRLYDRLSGWRAVHALESVWLIDAGTTAGALRDDLRGYIDTNDRLFVVEIKGATAWTTMMAGSDQFVWSRFGQAA
jgi:hypothetical protein